MVEDSPGVDPVEARVVEGELLGVGDLEAADPVGDAVALEALADELDRTRGEVDAGDASAGAGELEGVGSQPGADLEDLQVPGAGEVGEMGDVGLELVALALDLGEELRVPTSSSVVIVPQGSACQKARTRPFWAAAEDVSL